MESEKKDYRERELDSFLEQARESKRKRPDMYGWDERATGRPSKNVLWNVGIIAGVVIVLAIIYLAIKEIPAFRGPAVEKIIERSTSSPGAGELKFDKGKYQSVFLTNGQVYFGKITYYDSSYVELSDIYYLQVIPVLQQGEENNQNNNKNPQEQKSELSLVKLGNELHGPTDRMIINRDQVVFVEDMKDDSKVTDAIRRHQQGQK
jgi:hypothetical protein